MSKFSVAAPVSPKRYLLSFRSLFHPGRSCAFPCDAEGHVDMDELSEAARQNYLYARTVVGREYASPAVIDEADCMDTETLHH